MRRRPWLLWAVLGLLGYGVLCLPRFPFERQRAMAAPRMTCTELVQKGPVTDEYVTLTACVPIPAPTVRTVAAVLVKPMLKS